MEHRAKLSLIAPAEDPKPSATALPPLWTVKQAADWLSMTELSLRSMLKRRQIPASVILKFGRRVRFRSEMLREWALSQRSA